MAYPKRLNAINKTSQDRAVESHAGFVSFIAGKIDKVGIEVVLKSEKGDEFHWLKKPWERVLNFAEQAMIKQMPTKLEGTGEQGQIVIAYLPTVKKENG